MKKTIITHLWVKDFGWENTILIEEDFKELEKLGENTTDGLILIGLQNGGKKRQILKAYEQ